MWKLNFVFIIISLTYIYLNYYSYYKVRNVFSKSVNNLSLKILITISYKSIINLSNSFSIKSISFIFLLL